MKEHKFNIDEVHGQRTKPKRSSMFELSEEDYQTFIEDFELTLSEFKRWMNDVVLRGDRVVFPYKLDEFKTFLKFEDEKMHVMIDIADKAYEFLESKLWKDYRRDRLGIGKWLC